MRQSLSAGVLLAVLWQAAPAHAKKIVYAPTVHEGEKEVEYYVDWGEGRTGVDTVGHELSAEMSVGARDHLALYGVWRGRRGETDAVEQSVEWIHQFFEQGEHAWDVGSYLEYQVRDEGPPQAVEARVLLERTFPHTTLTLNPTLEKQMGANANGVEAGYGARLALRRWYHVEPALELYGELGEVEDIRDWPETSQLLGPVVDLRLGAHVRWQAGLLWGLTRDSDDVRIKSDLAVEWY